MSSAAQRHVAAQARSAWRRRNEHEARVRACIAPDERLRLFASGFETGAQGPEVVVMITARDAEAKQTAQRLLAARVSADWDEGWRALELGDFLLRLYPDRTE